MANVSTGLNWLRIRSNSHVPHQWICSYLACTVRRYSFFPTDRQLVRHLADLQFSRFSFCLWPIPASYRFVLAGQCLCLYSSGSQYLAHLGIQVTFSAAISTLCHLNSNFLDARFTKALQLIFYDSTLHKWREKSYICLRIVLSNTSPSFNLYGAREGCRTSIRGVACGGIVRSPLGRQSSRSGEMGGNVNNLNKNNLIQYILNYWAKRKEIQ